MRKLADRIQWGSFEKAFAEHYGEEGRPAKAVRLMVGLLLLKQMYSESDESVVKRWKENPYWQQFCGMVDFQWELPCDPRNLVYFRQRIGETGVALILAASAQMHGQRAQVPEVVVDSSVQEKNFTHRHQTVSQDHRAGLEARRCAGRIATEALPQRREALPDVTALA